MSAVTPTWQRAIREAIESALMDVHVALPCKVQSYDETTQRVDVIPQIKRPIENFDTGAIEHEELPVLPNIPVAFPRSSGFFCSFPIAKDDFVLVVFSEYSIDQWLEKGRVTAPGDIGHLTLTGGIALPLGPYPSAQALSGAHTDDMVLGEDGGTQIHLKPGGACEVTSGGADSADDFVALAPGITDFITTLHTILNAVAPLPTPGGGAAIQTAYKSAMALLGISAGSPYPSIASSNLKADD